MKFQNRNSWSKFFLPLLITAVFLAFAGHKFYTPTALAQNSKNEVFRVGERLTYNISLDRFHNVAFAEMHIVSRGKVSGKDAFEVQSKLKTLNYVTLDYLLLDLFRTALVSASDGTALMVKDVDSSTGAPIETVTNFLDKGGNLFDLSSLILKIRASNGSGSFEVLESDKRYTFTFETVGSETVVSDAGDFLTNILDVQSPFLVERGILNLRINLVSEGSNIPVLFRAKTSKGEFRALIASIQVAAPENTPTPTPQPVQSPKPTPSPISTPSYVDNQPLIGMPFELGETLDYSISTSGRNVGVLTLSARERKMVNLRDSLALSANITSAISGELLRVGNGIRSNVSPDSLTPFDLVMQFDGPLAGFNQVMRFDPVASKVVVGNEPPIDVPIGTHNILSLAYAIRQFNLTPSKDTSNPVNDTRVAVFWQGKTQIFTLRPAQVQSIMIGERKLLGQQIVVNTGNRDLDALRLSVWLSNDIRRIPIRFTFGSYQLDLIVNNINFQP